ncbi:MAG: hypothetical protein C0459_12840 [Chitinophaga sp.]|jgi:hypothetical protein|nr:hypothetical protein [Chitinophaga sp.]
MKKQTTVALLVATALIVFISYKWFQSNNPQQPTIIGKWKVDSVYPTGKDTSLSFFSYTLFKKDSMTVQFNKDSSFNDFDSNDTSIKKYYVKENALYVKADSLYKPYQIKSFTDSSFSILSKDSTMFILKRL